MIAFHRTGRSLLLAAGLIMLPALGHLLHADEKSDPAPAAQSEGKIITAAADEHRDTAPARSADATEQDLTGEGAEIVQTGCRMCRMCRMQTDDCYCRTGLFGWMRGGGLGGGWGQARVSDVAYPYHPGYPGAYYPHPRDPRDNQVYSAQGYGVPVTVPLAPCVKYAYNYGWGLPASRATPVGATYNRWHPNTWYSFSGPGPAAAAGANGQPQPPVIYTRTDTSQSGVYYRHVPRWQPVGYWGYGW